MDKGAHFFCCDFQVHTPRDQNWNGCDCVTGDERFAYAQKLIASCRDKNIHAIAITDHHDMAFIHHVKRACIEETDQQGFPLEEAERIVVYPGIELTLGVPCQALLILDASFPENMFSPLLVAVGISPIPDSLPRNGTVQRLDSIYSFSDLKTKLDGYDWLKDRYIIFPNVTGEGQFSLLRNGQMGKYIEMPCVGGYIDGNLEKIKAGPKNIISGKNKEWGNKRIACIQTSDNRSEDHRDLGASTSWIKWAVPTAEALRQACLAQESRISQDYPVLPNIVINSISVSNSMFLGPVQLEFNHQYNALIGGRGTGKSTILEYLRWALCDQLSTVEDDEMPNYHRRRVHLIEKTLRPLGGSVEINFEINSVKHIVRRSSVDDSILIKIGDSEMKNCTDEEIRNLFPIQAYSQKQLSDVSVRVEELLRLISTPVRTEISKIEQKLSERANIVRQAFMRKQRLHNLYLLLKQREIEENSLHQQVTMVKEFLSGLSEEDKNILEQGKRYDAASVLMQLYAARVSGFADDLRGIISNIKTHLENQSPPETDQGFDNVTNAFNEYKKYFESSQTSLLQLINSAETMLIRSDREATANPWIAWNKQLSAFKVIYQAALDKSSSQKEKMEQLRSLDDKLIKYRQETSKLAEEMRILADANEKYLAAVNDWTALNEERDSLLNDQCELLTANSGNSIRAYVRRYADASEFINLFRQILSGSRFQSSKLENIQLKLDNSDKPSTLWRNILADLELLALFDADRDGIKNKPETKILCKIGFNENDIDKISRFLNSDNWINLSLTPCKSIPVFEYRSREGEYIPFSNASAGQQATALLKTILQQSGPPLVIDQPEEDLDNPVIQEVVEKIWEAKKYRQLIFSSHNANLVVNGDAELVIWCNYRVANDQSRGMIAGEGAIDVPEVRNAIKKIMEGGEAAFNLRKEKYGF